MTFIKSKNTTNKIMMNVLIALTPIILFSFYKNGILPGINGNTSVIEMFYPILFIIVGALSSFVLEFIYCKIKKQEIKNKYAFFPGLFLSLLLPINTPLYIIIIGSLVATIFGKLIFGGFGKNIFNPALIGYLFIILFLSSSLGSYANNYEIDTNVSSTPLTNASFSDNTYEELIEPYGFDSLFLGFYPGGLAETSSLLILIGFIYLVITKSIKWIIPVTYVSTVFLITLIASSVTGIEVYYSLFHILSGGLLFGAVFMATDPVTSSVTPIGQVIEGVFLGIITVIFRMFFVEGVAYSILICNLFIFIFDKVGSEARFKKGILASTIIALIILIILTGISFKDISIDDSETDPNFDIISIKKEGTTTIYEVTQLGYGGRIKANLYIDSIITKIEVLNHNETSNRYDKIIDENYIEYLISNQNNLEDVDTIATVTITSNAFIKMIDNVLEYHN